MPLDVTVTDTSQPVRKVEAPALRSESSVVRQVESLDVDNQEFRETQVIEIAERSQREEDIALALRTAFEDDRLEAETRLALTVERIELEQTPQASSDLLQESTRVVVFGSLSIDVQA